MSLLLEPWPMHTLPSSPHSSQSSFLLLPMPPWLRLRDMLAALPVREGGFATEDGGGGVYGRPSTSALNFSL